VTFWILAGAAIAAGYALLWTGGVTVAAALLVVGYCAFAPWAIAGRVARTPAKGETEPPPYLPAAVAALAVFALYAMTIAPGTAMWDTSEYLAAAKVLGLPHPPGNPLFILVAHVIGSLPLPGGFALHVNLLAAAASALSAGFWFLVAHATTRRMFTERWARYAAAGAAVAAGAVAFTVWNQSVVNEKVYTLSLLQIAITTWLTVRWTQRAGESDAERLLWLGVYLCALGYAVHPAGYLPLGALGLTVLLTKPALALNPRTLIAGAALFVAGLTPFAFEPIRAAHDPAINEGEPTACAAKIGVACTFSAETYARLKSNVNREQYQKPPVTMRQAPFPAQMGMWWMYWEWQWMRDARGALPALQFALALSFLALAGVGAHAQWKHDRSGFVAFGTLVATVTVALVFYLNFKYGYSQDPALGSTVPREVRDRDYFFIWSFSAFGVWVGLGIASLWRTLASAIDERAAGTGRGVMLAAPVLAFALVPLPLNWSSASRAGTRFTADWGYDVLQSAPPGAIIVTGGDNDTFPLWYEQQVDGVRQDITVVISGYLGLDWLPWQLARRVPPAFDRAASPAIWKDAPIPAAKPVLTGTRGMLDSVPEAARLSEAQTFQHAGISAPVEAGVITRDQILLLQMIRDSYPARPILFTNPQFPSTVGLNPYLVRVGHLWQLMPQPITASADVMNTQGGWLDVTRTQQLWQTVYRGQAQVAKERDWVDEASLSMPAQYLIVGSSLADALKQRGDVAGAAKISQELDAIFAATRLQRLAGPRRIAD
jgi:hypothetical protein